jgi:nucleotidyltransferase/DNA polymerase involved in DNA repair
MLAQLIFVVSKGMGDNFRSQDIEFSEKWIGKDMGKIDCIEIPGIGKKKRKKLSNLGIENCAQLIEAYNRQDEDVKFVQSSVKTWIDDMEKGVDNEFLEHIPQYVMEV